MEPAGLPIATARAVTMGVWAVESGAGALRAGDERFSNGAARRGGGAVVVGAAEGALRVTNLSRRPQTVGVPTRFQSQAVPLLPHARASSLRRKTPRKPQKAARAAGLRRAPPHHSSQARSGIPNRKTSRMPSDGRPRGRGRATTARSSNPRQPHIRTPATSPTRESVIAQTQDTA